MNNDTDTWRAPPALKLLVGELVRALGERLAAVLLYGPAVRGETEADRRTMNVLVVLRDLELSTLASAGPVVDKWVRAGQPFPRLVTAATLAEAADVFPIELSEIAERHVVLHGTSPLARMPAIDREHLRLQCERELREKLMRLQESYALSHRRDRELRRLLVVSYPTFAALFRACLRLHGETTAGTATTADVTSAFCKQAAIDPAPFAEVDRLRAGTAPDGSIAALFGRYQAAIESAIGAIDRLVPIARSGGDATVPDLTSRESRADNQSRSNPP